MNKKQTAVQIDKELLRKWKAGNRTIPLATNKYYGKRGAVAALIKRDK